MSAIGPVSAADALRDLPGLRRQLFDAPDRGSFQPLGLGGVLLGEGVLSALPGLAEELRVDGGAVALLADCRPMAGGDPELKAAIEESLRAAGAAVRRVTIGDAEARVHADAATLDAATASCAGAGLLVSVGSGSVADVGKAVSARLGSLPHVVVQTAGSVNGFADDQSVLLVDGVKRTTPTRWPDRLIIDTAVLSLAPARLNRAGLGDLLATFTAPADWFLASAVGQDASYSPAVVALARAHVDELLEAAPRIGSGEPEALETLAAALALSGISMGVAGRTSPGSGMEHTVSHLLEMADDGDGTAPLHGAKVGVLTVLAALLWARVREAARAGALEAIRFPLPEEMERRVFEAFSRLDSSGRIAAECWRDYACKLRRWHDSADALRSLPARWEAVDAYLEELLVPPERLVDALRAAGAPVRLSELGVDAAAARWALANCHLMRDRFTVADLAFLTGLWEAGDVDELLDDAAVLGAGL
jgi:glycerol-1-phosphate dehydrogenase [NAD(P)+]